jgi:hypothetical protein
MVMAPNALHTITHHTQWFFSPWVHLILFLYPVLYFARRTDRTSITSMTGATGRAGA